MDEKLLFMWSRDQCLDKREKWLHTSVGLGFGIVLGYGLGLGFRSELGYRYDIRAQGLKK